MDRSRQNSKKEKPLKNVDKEKSSMFSTDVKTIKENLKIKEILRSVKMNNSMQIKAPRGCVVMNNSDFMDVQEDILNENGDAPDTSTLEEVQEAKNLNLVNNLIHDSEKSNTNLHDKTDHNTAEREPISDQKQLELTQEQQQLECNLNNESQHQLPQINIIATDPEHSRTKIHNEINPQLDSPKTKRKSECPGIVKSRERKLSLDHTILTRRREELSQSEVDLHSIGKSPVERKSSFFKKKMDSFLRNTTEIFKRQSLGSKSQSISRRESMSASLQSLNENNAINIAEYDKTAYSQQEVRGSTASIASAVEASEPGSSGSQAALSASQPSVDSPAQPQDSPNSVNDAYIQGSLINTRAISMSSGLDTAFGQRRQKTSKSNRVSWVASDSYLRRLTQDELKGDIYATHSYQDLSSIPENSLHKPKLDSKGRRLSYQRAVSGEDPLPPQRSDSSLRRKPLIPEHSEANYELANQLAEFTRNGVPALEGFEMVGVNQPPYNLIVWAEERVNIDSVYDWSQLTPNEEARQAVIRELIITEADYLRHLICLVEVFMAAAHTLQDCGKMLAVDTARLFSNIPDVLNASLVFWETTFYPMIKDAIDNNTPYNTEFMTAGFMHFREILHPYEKYVNDQAKVLDYFRTLSNNTDFMAYLAWCHAHKSCNRLQLADLMVKPMQRLTKYGVLLRRIITHTETEPERTSLSIMETYAKNYVVDINRSIRQREELEKLEQLANSIDVFEIDFKDDDMDRYFRMFSPLNLRAPMVNCLPGHSRSIIYQGDLRYKDNVKEMDVRVFLLTDMLLICKKNSKGSVYPYKLIRPKYMLKKLIDFPKYSTKNPKELVSLIILVVDEVCSSYHCFSLSDPVKDPNSQGTLKTWDLKLREARLTYDLGVWYAKNPSRDLSQVDIDSSSDYGTGGAGTSKGSKQNSEEMKEEMNIEREARERVATMLHRSTGASTDYDCSQASMNTDSFDASGEASGAGRAPALHSLRHALQRASTSGSSRQSRLSSFQQSTSAASHDEPQPGPSRCNYYRAGSSVEHVIPPQKPDDAVTSITVNVVSESESETVVPTHQQTPRRLPLRSGSGPSYNTLRVQPAAGALALVHSLPDLTVDPSPPPPQRPQPAPSPQSASEKLYQSHQELLQRNRLSAAHHHQYLSPDHRGTSYPPPTPTRAALRRGMAFSDSFKYPPLSKMGHVNSQSQQQQPEPQPGPSTSAPPKVEQGAVNPMLVPTTSAEKEKKSKHLISSRNKGGSRNMSADGRRKDDKAE